MLLKNLGSMSYSGIPIADTSLGNITKIISPLAFAKMSLGIEKLSSTGF